MNSYDCLIATDILILKDLLQKIPEKAKIDGKIVLYAAWAGQWDKVILLAQNGVNLNYEEKGYTATSFAFAKLHMQHFKSF